MDEPDAFSADNFPVFVTTHPPVTDVPSIYGTPILEYPGLLKVRSLYLHVKYLVYLLSLYAKYLVYLLCLHVKYLVSLLCLHAKYLVYM